MAKIQFQRMTSACAMFDLVDRFARERGVRGNNPRPIGTVKYYLVGRIVNGNRDDFEVPRQLITVRNPGGYDIFFDKIKLKKSTGLDDQVYLLDLDQGQYVIRIESSQYQTIELEESLPNSAIPITANLEPSYNYTFPPATIAHAGSPTLLRGSVRAIDGNGVANIKVQVPGASNLYTTDATGHWILVFPEEQQSEQVTVRFDLPEDTIVQVSSVDITQGQSSSLGQAGLRGRVISDAGLGVANTIVEVSGHIGEVITDVDGRWNYFFGLNQGQDLVTVTATLPSGETSTQSNVQVQAREIVDVPDFQF